MPTHSKRRKRSIVGLELDEPCSASDVNTVRMHNNIIANDRATLSLKLNDKEYRNKEKAVMAIPAVNIELTVIIPTKMSCAQPLSINAFR